jgi:hypothetical protein
MTITRYVLGLMLALALLVGMRLPLLRCEPFVPGTPLLFDEKDYIRGANAQAIGDNSNDLNEAWMRAPGTAWLLLSTARLRGVPVELAACDYQRMQIGLWAALLLVVSSIAALLFGRRAGLISALLVALLPIGVGITLMVHSDTPFAVAFMVVVWALLLYTRRRRLGWLLVAGVAAGCGALLRSPMLPLMPLFLLWVGVAAWRAVLPADRAEPSARAPLAAALRGLWADIRRTPGWAWLRALLPCVLLLVCTALVLAPWTVRNYRLYGGFIPSDTLGTVNLFNDNSPNGHVNNRAVRESSNNPAERQRFAMQQAWAVVSADPPRIARKVAYTSWLAWSPERFDRTLNFYEAMLERPLPAMLLTQLTVLMWLAVPLAVLGLAAAPAAAPGAGGYRLIALGLMLLFTLMMGATHFEERFRVPFLLAWLPYAGWALGHPRGFAAGLRRPAGLAAGALILVLGITYLRLLWPLQWDDARALALYARGQLRAGWSDTAGALADARAAAVLQPHFTEAQVAAAQLQARQGDRAGVDRPLRAALQDAAAMKWRPPGDATLALQQVLRAQGRADESAALDARLDIPARRRAEALAWRRVLPPGAALHLGEDDLGLVRGFYSANEQHAFRWSSPQAQLLLAGAGDYVCLNMSSGRPPDIGAPVVRLSARREGGSIVSQGQLRPPRTGWAWVCAPRPAPLRAAQPPEIELTLDVTGYNPFMHGEKDARDLGVAVQEAALRSGALSLDPDTGLLVDRAGAAPAPNGLQLIGANGAAEARPGTDVPLTLWWRSAEPPPAGAFTFLHLLSATGETVAVYNAPLAGAQRPNPGVAAEPLLDAAAIPLPANLAPGRYHLIGGAFDPANGARLAEADLGELVVVPK